MTSTAVAAAAMVVLSASQAPGAPLWPEPQAKDPAAGAGDQLPEGDDSYHTELPPLESPGKPGTSNDLDPDGTPVLTGPAEAGIPATVLAAYQRAESTVRAERPGCNLPWQLLAAIGKVESGQARGGAVDAEGTTTAPILGPKLDGNGFALIRDTDGGAHDGDTTHDRAVGPMQFIPSTWATWAADGNDDGAKDPNNIFDAALAAARYLCANGRNLDQRADLEQAILSYNRSTEYLRTVLSWLEFYRKGVREVPDTSGSLPGSPGAGNPDQPATRPVSDRPAAADAPKLKPGAKPKPQAKPGAKPETTPGPKPKPETQPGVKPQPQPEPGNGGDRERPDGFDGRAGEDRPARPARPGDRPDPMDPPPQEKPHDKPTTPGEPDEPGEKPDELPAECEADPNEPTEPGEDEDQPEPGTEKPTDRKPAKKPDAQPDEAKKPGAQQDGEKQDREKRDETQQDGEEPEDKPGDKPDDESTDPCGDEADGDTDTGDTDPEEDDADDPAHQPEPGHQDDAATKPQPTARASRA
ncbi:lytic murein transglycosylase [Streptomyces sp. JJ66]|uniref:lytic murein transglycosylase n=1 Tax=Streptomyces sp. JJ66 TaxID=2803843 RepID=UPI0027D864EC|nr:lytic murein transglycosylase [Streptomyces sp. JJ66]